MASKFGGIAVDDTGAPKSKFGGIAVEDTIEAKKTIGQLPTHFVQTKFGPVPVTGFDKSKPVGQQVIERAEPFIEAGGAMLGGALGTPADIAIGPLGTVAGSALGYANTKGGVQALKQALGYSKPLSFPEEKEFWRQNLLTGAEYEIGGQALGRALQAGISTGRYFTEAGRRGARKIATEAFGDLLKEAREVLVRSPKDVTASQALSLIDPVTGKVALNAPTAQALLQRAQSRDPEFFTKLFGEQEAKNLVKLQQIAGGADQTAARQAQEQLKKQLNERLIPELQGAINAANIGGQMIPTLSRMEAEYGGKAAEAVQDVRRFEKSKDAARKISRKIYEMANTPNRLGKYAYVGGLARKAEEVEQQAAKGSLQFGQARDFAAAGLKELENNNLKVLSGDSVMKSIMAKLSDPSIAGNRDVQVALTQVGRDIQKWTNAEGIIDGWALDSIRKNSVNAVIQRLYPAASSQSQKNLASKVIESIKPKIIDAIENAGGVGYREYLTKYAAGAQKINQAKVGAELLDLYKNNPKEFVRWVEGNAPEKIEEIFGPGQYNILKEMSAERQQTLQKISRGVKSRLSAEEQAKAGVRRLQDVLQTNVGFPRIPNLLSRKVTTANAVLDVLESKVSAKTMKELTEAAKSARNLDELLAGLPPKTRSEVISKLPEKFKRAGALFPLTESNEE